MRIRLIGLVTAGVILIALAVALAPVRGPLRSREAPHSDFSSGREAFSAPSSGRQAINSSDLPTNVTYLCLLSKRSNATSYKAYRVENATVYVPGDVNLFFEWRAAAVASEMGAEELSQRVDTLFELLRKEPGEKGDSDIKLMNGTLAAIDGLIRNLSIDRFREGALFVLHSEISGGGPSPYVVLSLASDSDLFFEWRAAAVASEMGAEELSQRMYVLSELLKREFEGEYSEDFRQSLEVAETGQGASYLWDVVRWKKEGLSNREMLNETLKIIDGLIRNLSIDRFREGALFVLYKLSLGGDYVLTTCDPPRVSFPTGWRYLYNFDRAGCLVWVGCYSSPTPQRYAFIGETCTTTYTTDMDYYWQEANRYCDSSLLKSIQIKWFHRALALSPYNWRHDIIWEGNKNSSAEWYTYGEPYRTTNPSSGWYYIRHNHYYVLYCCYPPRYYCNTHCGDYCIACDEDATQHFVGRP